MMIPRKSDARHKQIMLRLLLAILQDNQLRLMLQFKGGTYAALRGELDRFSVDLDFDLPAGKAILPDKSKKKLIRSICGKIFKDLDLEIKDQSRNYLQFFLRYEIKAGERNTIKLEINDNPSVKNTYEKVFLNEINVYCQGHSLETVMANKLVVAMNRYNRTGRLAGRDFYDLWHFFLNGLPVNKAVIEDLTKMSYVDYLVKLSKFIEKKLTDKLLRQDLNPLLAVDDLNKVIGLIKPELLRMLTDEMKREV